MTEVEKAAHDALIADVKKAAEGVMSEKVAAALEAAGFKTELNALEAKLTALDAAKTAEEITTLKGQVEKLALDLKAASEKATPKDAKFKTIGQILKTDKIETKGGESKTLEDYFKEMHKNKHISGVDFNISVKAAGTILTTNATPTVAGGIVPMLTDYENTVTGIPYSSPFFIDYMRSIPTDGNFIAFTEMRNPEGGAGMTAENAAKSQADFEWVDTRMPVEKVTIYYKASREALDDINLLRAEIEDQIRKGLLRKADSQAFAGDGVSPNLNGITTYAQPFTGGALAGTLVDPDNYAVINAAATQIATAEVVTGEPAGFMATHVFMNPVSISELQLKKASDEHYVFPPVANMSSLLNLVVVSNPRVPAGYFLIGDMSKAIIRPREAINVSVGYENDDFTKNRVTILGEMRLCTYVKSNDEKAFIYDSFANAIADLVIPT